MKINKIYIAALMLFATTTRALAVPPPDFVFTVGSQIVQTFSIAAVFLSTAMGMVYQLSRNYIDSLRYKKLLLFVFIILVPIISFGIAYFYDRYRQQIEFDKWIEESWSNTESTRSESQIITPNVSPLATDTVVSPTPLPSSVSADENVVFIYQFYKYLENKEFDKAYEVSTKKYNFATFESLYVHVEAILINKVERISDDKYHINVTLDENNLLTDYDVTMTLAQDQNGKIFIQESSSKQLTSQAKAVTNANFKITNTEFLELLNQNSDIFVLDAREDEEYEIGRFPGSTHIRLADLKDGQWQSLPADRKIYVLCWSGMRGKDTAEFLRTKGLDAIFLEEGANSWVEFGGKWEGEIKLSTKYQDERYRQLLTIDQLKSEMSRGTVIVDSRERSRYDSWHIPGSVNIAIINTPSSDIEALLAQVPAGSRVITVCDDIVNCFDARITGIKLEKNGVVFLGRYNKPWEYRSQL